jgi:hypothetical protein
VTISSNRKYSADKILSKETKSCPRHPPSSNVRLERHSGWHVLQLFVFSVALCNSFLRSSNKSEEEFCVLLYKRLFQIAASTWKRKWVNSCLERLLFQQTLYPYLGSSAEEVALEHKQVRRGRKEECQGCRLLSAKAPDKRWVLGEILLNTRHNSRPKQSSCSLF